MSSRTVILALAALLLAAHAARADVTRCDTLAGLPLDPHKVTLGVNFAAMDAHAAVAACTAAIKADPQNPRLRFELGRALERSGNYSDALQAYRAAAEQNYAAAQNAMGALYRDGIGIPADQATAQGWFEKAANQGYQPAVANLVGLLNTSPTAAAAPTDAAAPASAPAASTPAPVPSAPPATVAPPGNSVAPVPQPAAAPPSPPPAAVPRPPVPEATPPSARPTVPVRAPVPVPAPSPSPPRQAAAANTVPMRTTPATAPLGAVPSPPATSAALATTEPMNSAPPQAAEAEAGLPVDDPDLALTQCIVPEAQKANATTLDDGQAIQLLLGKCQRPWVAWVNECVSHGDAKDSCIRKSTGFARAAIRQHNATN